MNLDSLVSVEEIKSVNDFCKFIYSEVVDYPNNDFDDLLYVEPRYNNQDSFSFSKYYFIKHNETIVGYCAVSQISNSSATTIKESIEKSTHLSKLYIRTTFRNQGVGSTVLDLLNIKHTTCLKGNPAIHFYKNNGFNEYCNKENLIYLNR